MVNELILKLFGKALKEGKTIDSERIFLEMADLGYIIHPDVFTRSVVDWVRKNKRNINSTFYKRWKDVASKTRFELLIDQVLHYASTYGTDFTGTPYIPNEGVNAPDFTEFKLILPIAEDEVVERCQKMLYSGIALTQETIEDIMSILEHFDSIVDISQVRNREARLILFNKLSILPTDPVEMVRYIVYLTTGKTLLIKDRQTIEAIKLSRTPLKPIIQRFGIEELSSVFYRFKPIFLALKNNLVHRALVNELRRAARTNHKPMSPGYFETLVSQVEFDSKLLKKRLSEITNFKKITLLQAINKKRKQLEYEAYVIRNQKLFVKKTTHSSVSSFGDMYAIIYKDLVASLKTKACKVRLPKGVTITLPTSGKSFIGQYPIGTAFHFSKEDCIFGINWRGEDGAQDLDLSLMTPSGDKFGWNSSYYNQDKSVVYSGDMTSANPEATELFYAKNGFQPAIAKVNMFSGEPNSKFRFFLAKEKIKNLNRGYMVNPSNVVFSVDAQMDSKEKSLGIIADGKFVLCQLRTGKGRVSNYSVTDKYTQYVMRTLDCHVSLEQLLKDSGFKFVDEDPDIDLTTVSKDTLINLLS